MLRLLPQVLRQKAEAIFGEVDSAGRVLRGGGYSVDRTGGAGAYALKFRLPFSEKPVIMVTAQVRTRRGASGLGPCSWTLGPPAELASS
jgi:hypothetical protein